MWVVQGVNRISGGSEDEEAKQRQKKNKVYRKIFTCFQLKLWCSHFCECMNVVIRSNMTLKHDTGALQAYNYAQVPGVPLFIEHTVDWSGPVESKQNGQHIFELPGTTSTG